MDEILASIRRIISEDETVGGAAEGDNHRRRVSRGEEPDEDVLVLTDRIAPDAPSPNGAFLDDSRDIGSRDNPSRHHAPTPDGSAPHGAAPNGFSPGEVVLASSPEPQPAPPDTPSPLSATTPPATHPAPAPQPDDLNPQDAPIAERHPAADASRAFERLYLMVENAPPTPSPAVSSGGPTLEDITRDLLRPMIAAWLDENLADIVRARVDEEVERIARGRVR